MSEKTTFLGYDLNELANKAIQEKINDLEEENNKLDNLVSELQNENEIIKSEIKDTLRKSKLILSIFDGFRETYSSITIDQKEDDNYPRNGISVKRYNYIKNLMVLVYGIETKHDMYYGGLATNLAVAFYDNKKELINILSLIEAKGNGIFDISIINFIEKFTMPYDYDKSKIIEYVKKPPYNTNNCMNGINALIEYNCTPHDIIQQSKFIVDEDVFEIIIETISKKRNESYMLFQVYKHNSLITDNHIMEMGKHIFLFIPKSLKKCDMRDSVYHFISDNLHKLDANTVDKLFELYCNNQNNFSLFHWEKFPIEYQFKYLMSKSFDEVLNTTNHYSCKWSQEQKESFYKSYFKNK